MAQCSGVQWSAVQRSAGRRTGAGVVDEWGSESARSGSGRGMQSSGGGGGGGYGAGLGERSNATDG